MIFSVIIPAHNEEKYIVYALEALNNMDFCKNQFETIVVINGSTDRTEEIAAEYNVEIIIREICTPSKARNIGASKAKGQYLAFLDADCVPDPVWLSSALYRLKSEKCITGSKVVVPEKGLWIERAWFARKNKTREEVTYINSGNLFIEREIFLRYGGFDESLISGEDYELCLRLKSVLTIVSDGRIKAEHLGNPKTILSFVRREIWHGLGAFSSIKHNLYDKVLLATLVFTLCTLIQIIGVISYIVNQEKSLFLVGIISITLLLFFTVLYRLKEGADVKMTIHLFVLYYFYYLGRMTALFKIIFSLKRYRRMR